MDLGKGLHMVSRRCEHDACVPMSCSSTCSGSTSSSVGAMAAEVRGSAHDLVVGLPRKPSDESVYALFHMHGWLETGAKEACPSRSKWDPSR